MIRLELRKKVSLIPVFWGFATGSAFLLIGHRPEKSVVPMTIALAFLLLFLASLVPQKKPVRLVMIMAGLAVAGLSGYLCFHFPLPFA